MANFEFRLPDIGEGIAEGEIVRWMVKAGDAIKEEQEFVEVMTDKATVMITAPLDGKVVELRAKEGQVVPVESVIAVLEPAAGAATPRSHDAHGKAAPAQEAAPAKEAAKAEGEPAKQKAPAQSEDEPEPKEPAKQKEPAKAAAEPKRKEPAQQKEPAGRAESRPAPAAGGTNGEQAAAPGKVLAAPATRRRAREMGIDLSAVSGTGPRGRVMNEDLNTFLQAKPAEETAAAEPAWSSGRFARAASVDGVA